MAVAGSVPFLYMSYYAAPFVAYIRIHVPLFARSSTEQLLRWSKNIAPETEIEMTTVKSYGGLRDSGMRLSELRPTRALFGIQNLYRVPKSSSPSKGRWWTPKKQLKFYVGNPRSKTVESGVWQKALSQVRDARTRPS